MTIETVCSTYGFEDPVIIGKLGGRTFYRACEFNIRKAGYYHVIVGIGDEWMIIYRESEARQIKA